MPGPGGIDAHWFWLTLGLLLAVGEMAIPGVFLIWLAGLVTAWRRGRLTGSVVGAVKAIVGIQIVGIFRDGRDDKPIVKAAHQQGINVSALSIQYRHDAAQTGLVMGFAAVDPQTTEKTMQKLRSVLESHAPGR
mgnify:CR=1 FL=1